MVVKNWARLAEGRFVLRIFLRNVLQNANDAPRQCEAQAQEDE